MHQHIQFRRLAQLQTWLWELMTNNPGVGKPTIMVSSSGGSPMSVFACLSLNMPMPVSIYCAAKPEEREQLESWCESYKLQLFEGSTCFVLPGQELS